MQEIAEGNQKSFQLLFQRYSKPVLGYCTRLLNDRHQAEDVSQDVWIKVVRYASHYEHKGSLISWLFTIARNSSLNQLRAKERFQAATEGLEEMYVEMELTKESIEDTLSKSVDISELKIKIDSLPEAQRVVLVLWMSEDLSYEDIARAVGVSVSSVKSLLFRARQSLQETLGKGGSR